MQCLLCLALVLLKIISPPHSPLADYKTVILATKQKSTAIIHNSPIGFLHGCITTRLLTRML